MAVAYCRMGSTRPHAPDLSFRVIFSCNGSCEFAGSGVCRAPVFNCCEFRVRQLESRAWVGRARFRWGLWLSRTGSSWGRGTMRGWAPRTPRRMPSSLHSAPQPRPWATTGESDSYTAGATHAMRVARGGSWPGGSRSRGGSWLALRRWQSGASQSAAVPAGRLVLSLSLSRALSLSLSPTPLHQICLANILPLHPETCQNRPTIEAKETY